MTSLTQQSNIARKDSLNLLTQITGLPFGVIDDLDACNFYVPDECIENIPLFCRVIHKKYGDQCKRDMDKRLKDYLDSNTEAPIVTTCHAGLQNCFKKIIINNKLRAVLLCGEMRIKDKSLSKDSKMLFESFIKKNNIGNIERNKLENMLEGSTSKINISTLNRYLSYVQYTQDFFYANIAKEKEISEHLENIQHDILSMIQPVYAGCQRLKKRFDELSRDKLKRELDYVVRSANALAATSHSLKIDHIRDYEIKKKQIKGLIKKAIQTYKPLADKNFIEVIDTIEPFTMELSEQHMSVALHNLIHNAIKYSFRGTQNDKRFVKIDCSSSKHKDLYEMIIDNYGVGIMENEYDKIFDIKYQGVLTRDEFRSGSGMGLYIVKQIIERHHGSISVESQLASGTLNTSDPEDHFGKPHRNIFRILLPKYQD
jgi:signal transduction histidine kinase